MATKHEASDVIGSFNKSAGCGDKCLIPSSPVMSHLSTLPTWEDTQWDPTEVLFLSSTIF